MGYKQLVVYLLYVYNIYPPIISGEVVLFVLLCCLTQGPLFLIINLVDLAGEIFSTLLCY